MKSYVCSACGAELILNDNKTFSNCLYCGNNVAITSKEINELNIKKIIPFTIEKEEAIEKFNKIIKKDIIDARKVYVPVRYCNYEFDFLIYYQYVVRDSEDRDKYYDTEELIDGYVENDIIFSNSKIDNIYLPDELRHQERLDFDPVLLKDVSIEYSLFDSYDKIKNKINSDILTYGRSKIKREITEVYSINYFPTAINLENFSTLIPVYIMKTSDGSIFNIPGVQPVKYTNKNKRGKIYTIVWTIILLIGLVFLYKWIYDSMNIDVTNKGNIESSLFFLLIIGIPVLLIPYLAYRKTRKITDTSYDNFHYNRYSYGDNRKSLK